MPAVGAAIGAIGSAISGFVTSTAIGSFLTTNIFGRLLLSVAASALKAAIFGRREQPRSGIRTQQTQTGGVTPASFLLAPYATEGQLLCPPMSHGQEGGTPNAYLTYVIELGDIPGQMLQGLIIDGERAEFGTEPHADYGTPVLGRFTDHAWITYYDGSQTAADPMLLDKYGDDPDRPWQSDMIGAGLCYAILTFRLNREIFSSYPGVRFELTGIPLYDPRKDSSVGGDGTHRWEDRSTWEPSENFAVQAYCILRGIDLGGGNIWGGSAEAEDLPLSTWWAEMNKCDFEVALEGGGTEPAWRSAYEVFVNDEPAKVLEDMARGCSARFVENGGIWKVRVGGPGLPVYYFTDEDVIISEPEEAEPYSEARLPFNAVSAIYPEPEALWEPKDAPTQLNTAYEAEDGGQRRVAALTLSATPYPVQVQRVTRAYLQDERRLRQHMVHLPPEAFALEPLDVASWTSTKEGYVAKSFDIDATTDPLVTGTPQLRLREIDASDYDWVPGFQRTVDFANINRTPLTPQAVQGFGFQAVVSRDAEGNPRAPGLEFLFDGDGQDDVRGFAWEIRLTGTTEVIRSGSTQDLSLGRHSVFDGVVPDTSYEGRGQWIVDRPTAWTDWRIAVTADVGITADDLDDSILEQLQDVTRDALLAESRLTGAVGFTLDEIAERAAHDVGRQILESARVNGVVEEQRIALSAEIETLSEGVDGVADGVAALSATLTQNYRTAAAQDGVTAQLEQVISARFNTNEASLSTLSTAVATANQTIANLTTSVDARFDANTANLTNNYYTRTSTDAAIAAAVTGVTTTVGNLSSSVTAVQSSINGITGVYSVEIDNNGAISGFGLISDLVDGNPVSDFIVRADAFRFIDASGASGALTPFQIIGNEVFALNLTVRRANIGELSVDTLRIANGSVNERWRSNYGVLQGTGGFQRAGIIYADIKTGVNVYVALHVQFEHGYGNAGPEWGYRIRQDGTVLRERSNMTFGQDQVAMTFHTNTFNLAPEPGFNRRQVVFELEWQGVGNINADPLFEIEARYK